MAAAPSAPGRTGAGAAVTGPHDPVVRVLRRASAVAVAAVAAVVVVALAAPTVWARWPWVPFALGLLAGLPHGAVDHLVPWWTGTSRHPARLAGLLAAYVALAAGTFALARVWPVPALVALLLASLVHFGTGETAVWDLRARRAGPTLRAAGPGAVVVLGPFVLWPAPIAPVLDVLAPGSAAVVLDPAVRLTAGALTVAAVLVTVAASFADRRPVEVAELAMLVALVALVPPLASFGTYFGAWHGLRHLARLVVLDPGNAADLRAGRTGRAWGRLGLAAAAPTVAVLAALGVLLAVPGLFGVDLAGLASAGLALVLALTMPHMVVVAVLDRRQRPARSP